MLDCKIKSNNNYTKTNPISPVGNPPNNSSQLEKQKKRDFLPKGESGREAMKCYILFHNETITKQ